MLKIGESEGLIEVDGEIEYVASAKISQDSIIDLDTVIMKNDSHIFILTVIFDESEIEDLGFGIFDKFIDVHYDKSIQHVAIDTTSYQSLELN